MHYELVFLVPTKLHQNSPIFWPQTAFKNSGSQFWGFLLYRLQISKIPSPVEDASRWGAVRSVALSSYSIVENKEQEHWIRLELIHFPTLASTRWDSVTLKIIYFQRELVKIVNLGIHGSGCWPVPTKCLFLCCVQTDNTVKNHNIFTFRVLANWGADTEG